MEDGTVLWVGATHVETGTFIRKTLLLLCSWLYSNSWESMHLREGLVLSVRGAEQAYEGQEFLLEQNNV